MKYIDINKRFTEIIAERIARREFGAKRINVGDVGVYKIDGGYVIAYKSKTYRLH